MRDKLIKILSTPILPRVGVDPVEALADYLIDCGVTVQEWISVGDKLPKDENCVLVTVTGVHGSIYFHNAVEIANCICGEGWILESLPEWENPGVTHWMPLPEPPKNGRRC